MDQKIQWTKKRADLLKRHLEELREDVTSDRQAYLSLTEQHEREKENILTKVNERSTQWVVLLTNQKKQLSDLISLQHQERADLLIRHAKEIRQLERQIKLEKAALRFNK